MKKIRGYEVKFDSMYLYCIIQNYEKSDIFTVWKKKIYCSTFEMWQLNWQNHMLHKQNVGIESILYKQDN